jgi:hypothetical protein
MKSRYKVEVVCECSLEKKKRVCESRRKGRKFDIENEELERSVASEVGLRRADVLVS